jgi:hypothetical protein
LNTYTLVTADWFEVRDAYSLYLTENAARKFKTAKWWSPVDGAVQVYISKSALEKIVKSKEKNIFWSWEN